MVDGLKKKYLRRKAFFEGVKRIWILKADDSNRDFRNKETKRVTDL